MRDQHGDIITRGLDKIERIKRNGSLIIENDVSIGYNSMILSGVTIQNGAVILAGSVITKDVPPYAIVEGNPAKTLFLPDFECHFPIYNKVIKEY